MAGRRRGLPVVEEVLEHMAGDVRNKLSRGHRPVCDGLHQHDGIIDPRDTREVLSFCSPPASKPDAVFTRAPLARPAVDLFYRINRYRTRRTHGMD